MRKNTILQIPENGVFWLILFTLAFGSANSLYQKITSRGTGYEVHTEHISAVTTSGTLPVISIRDLISPEFIMSDGFSQTLIQIQ